MTISLLDVSSLLAVDLNGGEWGRGEENVLIKLPLVSYMLYSLQFASNSVQHTWRSCKTSRITLTVIGFFCWLVASFAASFTRWERQKTRKFWVILSDITFLFNILVSLCIFQYDWILLWTMKMIYYMKCQESGMNYLWKCHGIKICLLILFLHVLLCVL